jgi:hypothetical protein
MFICIISVLSTFYFLYTEIKGLRDYLQVELLQDQAQVMLTEYCFSNHPANKLRFGKLLLQLSSLKAVGPRSIEEVPTNHREYSDRASSL